MITDKLHINKNIEKHENSNANIFKNVNDSVINDFDKYLKDYSSKYNIARTFSKNNAAVLKPDKPIPESLYEMKTENTEIRDFIATPMVEFRKYYICNERNKKSNSFHKSEISKYKDEAVSPINFENDSNKTLEQHTDEKKCKEEQTNQIQELVIANTVLDKSIILSVGGNSVKDLKSPTEKDISESETFSETKNTLSILVNSTVEKINLPGNTDYEMQMIIDVNSKVIRNNSIDISLKDSKSNESRTPDVNFEKENEALLENLNMDVIKVDTQVINNAIEVIDKIDAKSYEEGNVNNFANANIEVNLDSKETTDEIIEMPKDYIENNKISEIKEIIKDDINVIETLKESNMKVQSDNSETTNVQSRDSLIEDVDNYISNRSHDGNDSPISLPQSLDDDNFWNV